MRRLGYTEGRLRYVGLQNFNGKFVLATDVIIHQIRNAVKGDLPILYTFSFVMPT